MSNIHAAELGNVAWVLGCILSDQTAVHDETATCFAEVAPRSSIIKECSFPVRNPLVTALNLLNAQGFKVHKAHLELLFDCVNTVGSTQFSLCS